VHALVLIPLLGGGRHAISPAADLGVTRQAVAQVVTTLERDGYVRRVTDPGDARAKLVCLTPRGRAALLTMHASARHRGCLAAAARRGAVRGVPRGPARPPGEGRLTRPASALTGYAAAR
jgi:DNA-binding HxlR family transcriptional regulator